MKTCQWNSKPILFLAAFVLIRLAGSAQAADFFPLDVWEEMAGWRSETAVMDTYDQTAFHVPLASQPKASKTTRTFFPLDVWEELNALDRDSGDHAFRLSVKKDVAGRNRTNPYWLPEEFRADPSPDSKKAGFGNYLTDFR